MIYLKDTQDPQTIYIDGKGQAVEKTGISPLKMDINTNGTYSFNASSEGLKGYNPVNVDVNVSASTLNLDINTNGTYTYDAKSEGLNAYNPVNVKVNVVTKGMVGYPYLLFSFKRWSGDTFPGDAVINLNGARADDTAFGENDCKEFNLTNIGLTDGYLIAGWGSLFREAREVVRISDFNVKFDTRYAEARWNDMFNGCRKLTALPHIHFSITGTIDPTWGWGNQAYYLFWNCNSLTRIENFTFDEGMFLCRFNGWIGGDWDSSQGDYPLEYVQAFPCRYIEDSPNIFERLPENNKLTYFGGFTGLQQGDIWGTNKVYLNNAQHLTTESLTDIINNLAQGEESNGVYPTIVFNTECEARMTDETKALAVSKNWTIEFGDRM